MKRILSLLLVFAMMLSMAACGAGTSEETAAPETSVGDGSPVPEETEAPTTEPTLSAEEILYNSLTERQRQAVDVGLVALEQLEDLDRIVTVGEASEMLQKAYVYRCGVESKTLNDLMTNEAYSTREANLWWMSGAIALADLELIYGDQYEDYEQWWSLCKNKLVKEQFWNDFCWLNYSMSYNTPLSLNDNCAAMTKDDMLYAACNFWHGSLCTYTVYDQNNGLATVEYENASEESLLAQVSVGEVVEFALRFANSATPVPTPEWVEAADVKNHDTSIITPDLLTKGTQLPTASCEVLPSQWHGIVMDDLCDTNLGDLGGAKNTRKIYEHEIQKIQEAGFNFIGLEINFSLLQSYDYSDLAYYKFDGDGRLDENRLKELDQILAWCMERDIHLDIRAAGMTDCYSDIDHDNNSKKSSGAAKFSAVWQALARRYADIPNEYLSFTVLSGDYGNTELLTSAVEAIRVESPNRCIMVDAGNCNVDVKPLAEMGVALSYKFGAAHSDLFDVWAKTFTDENKVESFSWPYNGLDAKSLLDGKLWRNGPSANEAMAIATEYGVGFMLADFGIPTVTKSNPTDYVTVRFPDAEYQKMIEDITLSMEELGYGWCFSSSYGSYGLMFAYPVIVDAEYTQIENYPCYVDQTIFGWFQEINGVA